MRMHGVGQDDALDRRVGDVPLVPQRDVLQGGTEVAAQHAGLAAQLFALDRVALMGHRRRPLLAGGERLGRLPDLRALKVTDLGGDQLDRGADGGAGVEQFGVAVAGDHLRRGNRGEAERGTHRRLDRRVDVGVGPHRSRQFPDSNRRPGRPEAPPVTVGLKAPQGQLGPEGGRLGVDPVGPSDGRGGPELPGPGLQDGDEPVEGLEEHVGGPGQVQAEGRIDDI